MMQKQKPIAIFCAGDDDYFSTTQSPPYVALSSFRDQFEDEMDYFCCGKLGNDSIKIIKQHNFIPMYVDYDLDGFGNYLRRWPHECFMHTLMPEMFLKMGYRFSISIDGDVYCCKRFDISEIQTEDCCMSMAHHPGNDEINSGVVLYNNENYCSSVTRDLLLSATVICRPEGDQQLFQYLIDQIHISHKVIPYWYNFCLRSLKLSSYMKELHELRAKFSDDIGIIENIRVAHFVRGKPWIAEINREEHWNYELRNYFVEKYMEKMKTLGIQ